MYPMVGTSCYLELPLCIDQNGHHFTIPPVQSKAVCSRCGLIREQPKRRNASSGIPDEGALRKALLPDL
jgi:hypothetical protein